LSNENCVEVNYEVHVHDKRTQKVDVLRERHCMRYLFLPEIRELFSRYDMEMIVSCEWLTDNEPGVTTWNLIVGGRVKSS